MTLFLKRHVKLIGAIALTLMILLVGSAFEPHPSAGNKETYEGLKLFSDVLELVEKNYVDEVDSKELIEDAIQGMVNGLDPHSVLLDPESFKDLQVDTQGEFTGIGISISMRDGFIMVIAPIEGTPAYRAGIKAGDKIIEVDGQPARDLREAVKMIRGPKATEVVVTILREDETDPIDFTLIRDVIPLDSIRSAVLKPGYGYIWVTNFRDSTSEELEKALTKLETSEKPMKGLVLDLRDNPGGLLSQSIQVSDLFLEEGIILSIKGRHEDDTKEFNATANRVARKYPMVVLINDGSASASEIVAGALQDHHRALILGTTSFGKGSVQNVESLAEGYGLKLTIARYYTPSGRSIQAKGIEPDIVVERDVIDPENPPENGKRRLKEKDLQNHLDAEQPEAETPKEDSQEPPLGRGEAPLKKLQQDNQVMRALDILVSYQIFSQKNGK